MDNLPTPDDHSLYDGNVVIDQIEALLRKFGGDDLSQQDAVRLLGMWRKNSALTARERAAVLDRFTPSTEASSSTINAALEALTFGGDIPVAEIPRDRAERLLSMWAHNNELTDREREAVLARFPGAEHPLGRRELEYRRRLDAWSREQTRALDELHDGAAE